MLAHLHDVDPLPGVAILIWVPEHVNQAAFLYGGDDALE